MEDTPSNISMQRKFCVTIFGLLCTQQHQQSQWQSLPCAVVHNNPSFVLYLGWNVPTISFKTTWNGGMSCEPDKDGTLGCSFAPGLEKRIAISKLHFNFHLNFLSRIPKQQCDNICYFYSIGPSNRPGGTSGGVEACRISITRSIPHLKALKTRGELLLLEAHDPEKSCLLSRQYTRQASLIMTIFVKHCTLLHWSPPPGPEPWAPSTVCWLVWVTKTASNEEI